MINMQLNVQVSDNLFQKLKQYGDPKVLFETILQQILNDYQMESVNNVVNTVNEGGIRGTVIKRWVQAKKPKWDYVKTEQVVIAVDSVLESKGENPAPKMREARRIPRDEVYLSRWIYGCKFPWLEPYYYYFIL